MEVGVGSGWAGGRGNRRVRLTLQVFLASLLSGMSVGGSETRAWELLKEGRGWGVWLLGSRPIRAGG